jgi:NhaP-type Na+/H+ or K+/H+ antiporter
MILATTLDFTNPYILIIGASAIVILSYLYNIFAEKTSIPSVLMLILTGIIIQQVFIGDSESGIDFMPALEILGIIGLIMIVLEAALDLELSKEKLPLIGRTLIVSLFCLLGSTFTISWILQTFLSMPFECALVDAIPLSIMSSAIIIPSVGSLVGHKKEFMIYESAFSDILGIMLFYFALSYLDEGAQEASAQFGISFIATIVVSIIASFGLVFFFKDIKGHIRLFLLISILLLLFSLGKLFHLSPLLIILVFGLMLANHQIFFKIFKNDLDPEDDPIEKIEKEFHLITLETAFLVRTFFFVCFGLTISLSSLLDKQVLFVSLAVLIVLYFIRVLFLQLFARKNFLPELWIAPRGLITILLFFAIPEKYQFEGFNNGILLYVIIISSLVMTFALIANKRKGKSAAVSEGSAGPTD